MGIVIGGLQIDVWPFALGILFVSLIIMWRRGFTLSYVFLFGVFCFYLLSAAQRVFFPLVISGTYADLMRQQSFASQINFIPFHFGPEGLTSDVLFGLILNIILTIPFGFGINFVAALKPRNIIRLAPAIGIGIEAIQFAVSVLLGYTYRTIDVNDAIMNTLGVLVGYCMFLIFARFYVWVTQRLHIDHRGLAAYIFDVSERVYSSQSNHIAQRQ